MKHHIKASIKDIMFLNKLNSAGWKPYSATTLNTAVVAVIEIAATFIAMIAMSLLSLFLGDDSAAGVRL